MAEPSLPTSRVYVTVGGHDYELVPTAKLTFPETKEAKRISGGMALVDLEQGIQKSDPDAWFAWIYVSVRRATPTITEQELIDQIGDTPIVAVIGSVREEALEVATPDPPAPTSTSGGETTPNGSGSGETTPLLSTLATAGQPTSETPT